MPKSDDPKKPDGARWESEVIRAARSAEQQGLGDMWDQSGRMFGTIHAEVEAREEFRKAGLKWPTACKEFWSKSEPSTVFPREPAAFVRERWGEGLLALFHKRRFEKFRRTDPLDSPTIRRLLLILEEGVQKRRPEFEEIARKVATLIGPLPGKGNRTKLSIEEEEKRSHAAFVWVRFRAIFGWLDLDMPEETDQDALLSRLRSGRPYISALARVCPLHGAAFRFEPEMLQFVAGALSEYRRSDGMRAASAMRRGFTAYCVQIDFAPTSTTHTAFVNGVQKWMRKNWSK